jgi:hypothetical protein
MSWRDELQEHQIFAEALCRLLAMHALRGKQRNNTLVPPSLQAELFRLLASRHGPGPQAVWRSCFPDMDEASFDDLWYRRANMDLTYWKTHVQRLARTGKLSSNQMENLLRSFRPLYWAHDALSEVRSALNRKTWDRIVDLKGYMLFSWPVPGEKSIRQTLGQRQRRPWQDRHDHLDRNPRPDLSLPTERMTAVNWWPDRSPVVWQIALTPYPLKFDASPASTPAQWAVRLHVDPYEAVWAKMKREPRYQDVPTEWGSCEYDQTLALLRTRHAVFANP